MDDHSEEKILARAAALESHSTHPVARAILALARAKGLEITPADHFTTLRGRGPLAPSPTKPTGSAAIACWNNGITKAPIFMPEPATSKTPGTR